MHENKATRRESHNSVTINWQQVYTSLLLILLVFFVALFAHSSMAREVMSELHHAAFGKRYDERTNIRIHVEPSEWQGLQQALSAFGPGMGCLERMERGIRVHVATAGLFQKGTREFLPQGRSFLDALAKQAMSGRWNLAIELPVECRTFEGVVLRLSWQLAVERAARVRYHLRQVCGLGSHVTKSIAVGRSCIRQNVDLTAEEREGKTTFYLIR